MAADFTTTAIGVVVGLVVGSFAALTIVGVVLLARRARREKAAGPRGRTDAGAALVRADEAVRAAGDDLAFAAAQFGEQSTAGFAAVLASARADLDRAFALQHGVDDDRDDPRTRERLRQVRALAERARTDLETESARFRDLRRNEANAPATVRVLRDALDRMEQRVIAARSALADLTERYPEEVTAGIATGPDQAEQAIALARDRLDAAELELDASRVTTVTDAFSEVQAALGAAAAALDGVEHRAAELAAAEDEIQKLATAQRGVLSDARAVRDDPPDSESASVIADAIVALETELSRSASTGRRDPVAQLDRLVDASNVLDSALARGRNEQRRLRGARSALEGALVSARVQIGAVSDYIGSRGGGSAARTRLAEAERELLLAEHESDPVAALDAARRAQTHARDADALARYSGG